MFCRHLGSLSLGLLLILCPPQVLQTAQACTALQFDGNDVVTFGNVTAPFLHTLEAWVRVFTLPSNPPGFALIFSQASGPAAACSVGAQFKLEIPNDLIYDVNPSGCGTSNNVTHPVDTLLGEWTHMAGTYDGDTARLYINGEMVNQLVGVSYSTSTWTLAGAFQLFNGLQGFFNGELDELRIWDFARSEQEIQDTMHRLLSGTEPGLVAYWKLDEGEGQEVGDSSSAGFTGVLGTNINVESSDPTWVVSGAPIQVPLFADGFESGDTSAWSQTVP